MFSPEEIKKDFPILSRKIGDNKLVYLDNAATSQKPMQVIDTISDFYKHHNANVHRGIHTLSEETINQIGDVDILFVPVGGFFTLDVEKAIEVVHSIEPKVIIPMHFKVAGLSADLASKLASVDDFVAKASLRSETYEKYTLKSLAEIPPDELIAILAKR